VHKEVVEPSGFRTRKDRWHPCIWKHDHRRRKLSNVTAYLAGSPPSV